MTNLEETEGRWRKVKEGGGRRRGGGMGKKMEKGAEWRKGEERGEREKKKLRECETL